MGRAENMQYINQLADSYFEIYKAQMKSTEELEKIRSYNNKQIIIMDGDPNCDIVELFRLAGEALACARLLDEKRL